MIYPAEIQTAAAVARHYDELDRFYREIWGDHVHHGYWATGRETPEQAVEALVDLLAERLEMKPGLRLCDIGCGYGATARYLAERHRVHVTGLTISPVQASRAMEQAAGFPLLDFACKDWLGNDCPDEAFDRVYSIESSEHMVDKARFFREAFRTLRPGGRLGVYAWLARERARPWEIKLLLEPICREGRLPSMGTESDYRKLAEEAGFRVTSFDDLSMRVRRTWTVCARRVAGKIVTKRDYRRFLLDGRSRNRVFAWSVIRLFVAFHTRSVRYCLLTANKSA